MLEQIRKCKKCFTDKPMVEFHRFSAKPNSRHRYECKVCLKNRTKLWSQTKTYKAFKKDKCEDCAFTPINSCQLDVDHIDGNHNNHDATNLRTLCANCHRLKTYLNKETRWRGA